ncbi:MAG: LEA type 2 family protein [Bradymonadaceae bacterium]
MMISRVWRRLCLSTMIVGLCLALAGCATPTARLQDVLLERLTTTGLQVGLVLDLFNPNDFGLPLDTVNWNLSLFSSPFAQGLANFGRQIAANSNSRVDIPISIAFADVAASASQVLTSRTIPWDIGGACNFRLPTGPLTVDFRQNGSWANPLQNAVR